MNITYINHSGFCIETDSCYIIFDYFNGALPEFEDKPIYIFSSHGHQDHFNRELFNRFDDNKVKYVFCQEILKRKLKLLITITYCLYILERNTIMICYI